MRVTERAACQRTTHEFNTYLEFFVLVASRLRAPSLLEVPSFRRFLPTAEELDVPHVPHAKAGEVQHRRHLIHRAAGLAAEAGQHEPSPRLDIERIPFVISSGAGKETTTAAQ